MSAIAPSFNQTPATWVALTAAYDSDAGSQGAEPANFKGMHAADMAGVLSRLGFTETDRKETDVIRAFTMKSPNKGFVVTLVEVNAPQFFTSASIVEPDEE